MAAVAVEVGAAEDGVEVSGVAGGVGGVGQSRCKTSICY